MRKMLLPLIVIVFILGCFKTNSTIPITSVQVALDGHWQVDSSVSKIGDSVLFDSVYTNHYIDISSSGTMVTVLMNGFDPMKYTISDSTLGPYSSSFIFPGRSVIGCGIPYANTTVSISANHLIFYSNNYVNSSIATYMHKNSIK